MPLLPRRRSTLDLLTTDLRSNLPGPEGHASKTPSRFQEPQRSPQRPTSEYGWPVSTEDDPPDSPPLQAPTPATKRFSMLKFRHFSDTQLATRARLQAEKDGAPPVPALPNAPAIITTAPTMDLDHERVNKKKRSIPFKRQLSKINPGKASPNMNEPGLDTTEARSILPWRRSHDIRRGNDPDRRLSVASSTRGPVNANGASPTLDAPGSRLSESSRSDELAGGHVAFAQPDGNASTKSLFKMPRRNKRKSLFPLPIKIEPPQNLPDTAPATPRASTSAFSTKSVSPAHQDQPASAILSKQTDPRSASESGFELPTHPGLTKSAVSFAPRGYPLLRNDSNTSTPSTKSSLAVAHPRRLGLRDRASTMSTFGRPSDDLSPPTPPTLGSGRNSTSTAGRSSLGGFLSLNRFRHGSDAAQGARHDSPGTNSKSNSFAISREAITLPEREEGEPPVKYLERLQSTISNSLISGLLSKSTDPFFHSVLRSYTRRFAFFGEPIDMSLRKFLLEADLPKETQQVDRVIQAFADRYHECNPGIFLAPDQAYIIAFSLMMLHTDAFNKNNKRKMQKGDYIKNTSGQHVSEDVLGCFYDNICYTPFIHFDEDDFETGAGKALSFKPKKNKLKGAIPDTTKKPSGPVDPYALICDAKLDVLRPSIKESISMDDPYSYVPIARSFDIVKMQKAFINTGILQIISARSRPAAFESQASRDNPDGAKPGVVDLKITKVGILWRKSSKRKKTRSPWHEWGGVLTGSQLYLFKNAAWVKSLIHQHTMHLKHGNHSSPVIFKPPISDFKPDALIKTDEAVALLDASYTRHKNAFTLVRTGGEEEVFLADSESDLNDWLGLVNYAAAFRFAGVRIRGFIGASDIEAEVPSIGRLDSSQSLDPAAANHKDITPHQKSMNPQLARQVMAARRQQLFEKIGVADQELAEASKELDELLRNARHLQILAPIQPRTREAVNHGAARLDAMLKWTRRNIWRTRCYKDILSLDAQEDSDAVVRQSLRLEAPIVSTAARRGSTPRRPSKASSVTDVSHAPHSPPQPPRPGTMSSTQDFMNSDVFRTPPEQLQQNVTSSGWTIPPLDLDTIQTQRRQSASSTVPSSPPRPYSMTHASSMSSVQDVGHRPSTAAAETTPMRAGLTTPATSVKVHEGETPLAPRDALAPSLTATTASSGGRPHSDLPATFATPESNGKSKHSRRSLHRTLRDSTHEHGSLHRHRKGKESASTIKSEGTPDDASPAETTPGLERSKGNFIVHGKKASVITFGGDWTDEQIRSRHGSVVDHSKHRSLIRKDGHGKHGASQRLVESEALADAFASDGTATIPSRSTSYSLSYDGRMSDADAPGQEDSMVTPRPLSGHDGRSTQYFDARGSMFSDTSLAGGSVSDALQQLEGNGSEVQDSDNANTERSSVRSMSMDTESRMQPIASSELRELSSRSDDRASS